MAPDEFDQYLADLEVRLERLRSLYEQYFMGMERTEPLVARKDVDRRFWTLRREKVHNTARRFKLQMLVQRYNTLQQYWQRTCREIENGTYRRHKLKAERTIPLASEVQTETPAPSSPSEAASSPVQARAQQATRSAEEDLRALLASDFDPAAEVDAALDAIFGDPAPTAPPRPAAPAPRSPPPRPSQAAPGRPIAGSPPAGPPRPPPALSQRPGRAAPPLPPPSALPPPQGVLRPQAAPPAGRSLPPRPPPPRSIPSPRAGLDGAPARPAPPPAPVTRPAQQRAGADRSKVAGPSAAAGSALSDARIRELHTHYLASRQGSRTPPVSFEKLAQSLRATEAKLRQQHQGRRVDFDVVVRDGKPVIKPKISR